MKETEDNADEWKGVIGLEESILLKLPYYIR